jgi:glutathione S-transferase
MTTLPERELIYFDIRGRAEAIRLLLAHARVSYLDRGVARAEWPALKPTLPLGQMPVWIEREGGQERLIPQTYAILRHLARAHDLYGADEDARVRCDVVADCVVDLRALFNPVAYYPGWLKDEAAIEAHFRDKFPRFRAIFEDLLEKSEERGHRFFAGPAPTWADFVVFDALDAHLTVDPSCLDGHGATQRFLDDIRALPAIADYLARRRPSELKR